ncbi:MULTISPECIES: Dps family protein [Ahrensia]|uniref:DNA starvation/stationary phase protection protein n=1 Tax=Ahrensia kielensis TaxID=76980 RepID=A0ABU9T702_9HYPH|nr:MULTISPECIES: DNA starvation/stationary phase protection protein [Ahrensia]
MAKVTALNPKTRKTTPEIGLEESYLEEASKGLSEVLASTYKLMIKTQVYHWNVVGPLFGPIHELTEAHYNTLFEAIDIIAERVRALGHIAPVNFGDMKNFAPTGHSVDNSSAHDMVADLIKDHEAAARTIREVGSKAGEAGDMVTEDMLTARLTFHEKALWMLKAIVSD